MSKGTSPISPKSIAIIAGAVFLTIIALLVISSTSDNPAVSSLVPNLLKRKPKAAPAPVSSPFGSGDNRILFAKRGDTEIFKEERDGQWVVIIDGQESALYDDVSNPTFSSDGSEFAYSAELDGQEFVIMDGEQQGKGYLNIIQILFNPDGSILAFLADTGEGKLVVVNGVEGMLYDNISTMETESGTTYLVFSADGTQIAYYATQDGQLITVINGQVTDTQPITPTGNTGSNNGSNNGSTTGNSNPPGNQTNPGGSPSSSSSFTKNAKDPSRNLSPDIDRQPDRLNPLICGQTTECNF